MTLQNTKQLHSLKSSIHEKQSSLSAKQIPRRLNQDTKQVSDYLEAVNNRKMRRKKITFHVAAILLPFIILATIELALRIFDYGADLSLVQRKNVLGQDLYVLNVNAPRRYFPKNSIHVPELLLDYFTVEKSPDTYRIFCLGGSTTAGFPYALHASFPYLLKDRLTTLLPSKRLEVINVGVTALNSFSVMDFVDELMGYEPDLFIIYMGHNEFYGPLGVGSSVQWGGSRTAIQLYLYLQDFKLFRLMKDLISKVTFQNPEQNSSNRTLMQIMAEKKQIEFDSKTYQTAKSYFRSNLKNIIKTAQKAGAKVLVSNLVSNENGIEPFTWSFHERTSEMEQNRWRQLYKNGFSYEERKAYLPALACYREAERIDAFPAILQFRIGKCLEVMGEYAEARKAYRRARDYDMLRFRASSEFNQIIRDVSHEFDTAFINMDSVFAVHSEHGIIGNGLITEHLHPNFNGYFLMAKHMTQAIAEHNLVEPVEAWRWDLDKSDAEYIELSAVSEFDELLARCSLLQLTSGWPFKKPLTLDISKLSEDEQITLETARRSLRMPKTWRNARHQLAEYFLNRNDYRRAKAEYRAICKLAPLPDYLAFVKLGDIALIEEDFDQAQKCYTTALQKNSLSADVQAKLGILYLIQNNYERSRSLLEQSLCLVQQGIKFVNISELEARYFLSFCCLKLADLSAARNQIEKVLKKQPNHSKALSLLSEINLN